MWERGFAVEPDGLVLTAGAVGRAVAAIPALQRAAPVAVPVVDAAVDDLLDAWHGALAAVADDLHVLQRFLLSAAEQYRLADTGR